MLYSMRERERTQSKPSVCQISLESSLVQSKIVHQLESQLARVGSPDDPGQLCNEVTVVHRIGASFRNRADGLLQSELWGNTEALLFDQSLEHLEHLGTEEHFFAFNHQVTGIVGQRDNDLDDSGWDGDFIRRGDRLASFGSHLNSAHSVDSIFGHFLQSGVTLQNSNVY